MNKNTLTQISLAIALAIGSAHSVLAQDLPIPDAVMVNQRFDFSVKGDIEDVLWALWQKNKAFTILPPTGTQFPLPVEVNLKNTNTLEALKAIGLKAGLHADVILNDKYVRIAYVGRDGAEIQAKLGLQNITVQNEAAPVKVGAQRSGKTDLTEETNIELQKSQGTYQAALKAWGAKAGYNIIWELKPGTTEPAIRNSFAHVGSVEGAMNKVIALLEEAGYEAGTTAYSNRYIKFVIEPKKAEDPKIKEAKAKSEQLERDLAEANRRIAAIEAGTSQKTGNDDAAMTALKAQALIARQDQLRAQERAEALARELAQTKSGKPAAKGSKGKEKIEEYLVSESIAPTIFDLRYKGDLQGALLALQEIQPQLQILPSTGASNPVQVDLNLRGTRLTDALRAIEEQTSKMASLAYANSKVRVVYKTTNAIGNSALDEAKRFQAGAAARPILGQDGVLLFPFGEAQPELTCAPLRACDIQLQAGESINQVVMGDPVRWISAPINSGEGPMAVPHVVVKPTEKGLVTNLIITTNRRTYVMTLKSSELDYVSRAGYYYPRELVQDWSNQADATQKVKDEDNKRKVSDLPVVSVDQINFSYDIKADDSVQWNPVRVFDDGTRVYIQMPASLKSSEAPAFVILDNAGNSELVNYRVKDLYYIVDKIFTRGALIVGVGSEQKKVEIVRKSENKGFFGTLFGGK